MPERERRAVKRLQSRRDEPAVRQASEAHITSRESWLRTFFDHIHDALHNESTHPEPAATHLHQHQGKRVARVAQAVLAAEKSVQMLDGKQRRVRRSTTRYSAHLFQSCGRTALWCHSVTQMLARYRIFDLFRLLHLLDGERNRLVTWLPEDALFEYTCERLQTTRARTS